MGLLCSLDGFLLSRVVVVSTSLGTQESWMLSRFKKSMLFPHCPGSAGPSAAGACRCILGAFGAGALKLSGMQSLRKHLELAFY